MIVQHFVFPSVLVDLLGHAHILFAVLFNLINLALFVPALGRQSVGAFFHLQSGLGDIIQLIAAARGDLYHFKNIKVGNSSQIAGIVFIENRQIKVFAVVADQTFRPLENRPQSTQLVFAKGTVAVVFVFVERYDRHLYIGLIPKIAVGLDIKNNFATHRPYFICANAASIRA